MQMIQDLGCYEVVSIYR